MIQVDPKLTNSVLYLEPRSVEPLTSWRAQLCWMTTDRHWVMSHAWAKPTEVPLHCFLCSRRRNSMFCTPELPCCLRLAAEEAEAGPDSLWVKQILVWEASQSCDFYIQKQVLLNLDKCFMQVLSFANSWT